MPPSTVLPPPPRAEEAPPRLPTPVPLRTGRRLVPHPARSPQSLALSLGVHLVLVIAAVLLVRGGAPIPRTSSAPEPTAYIDIGAFPGTGAAAEAGGTRGRVELPPVSFPALPTASPRQETAAKGAAPLSRAARPAGRGSGASSGAASGAVGGGSGVRTGVGTGEGEALRPGWRDPRLIPNAPGLPAERPLSDHERYMASVQARVNAFNDSVAGEADRARRARDWTVRGKNGKRWGIGPGGKVVVDGVEIPVPLGLPGGDAQTEQAARDRSRQRDEINRQADDAARAKALDEQKRSARERRDRERGEAGQKP